MELRTLTSKDIFPMCNILGKIGIDQFKGVLTNSELQKMLSSKKADAKVVGLTVALDVASIVLNNLPKCEADIYSFLASITKTEVKELEEMPMGEFTETLVEVVKKPEFKDFFKAVSKFIR